MRDQEHWTKMEGVDVYPPVYTKVMGRPRRNRKKDPEEKLDKEGGKKLTKHGVSMHCSICGAANHNKKGHQKWAETNREAPVATDDDSEEEFDDPSIISNIMPHTIHPSMDPTQTPGSMVYLMQQMERMSYQPVMDHGPLPESSFVAQARASIPPPRVTTAMATGRVRRRGVTEDIPEDVPQFSHQTSDNARGRKRQAKGGGRGNATGSGTGSGTGNASRGGRGNATGGSGRTRGEGARGGTGRGNGGRGTLYDSGGRTGPGAGYWNLMFGPDSDRSHVAAEEEPITQNAPQGDEWDDDFVHM
ncbi:guanyl-specific ribonuclease pgl-1-like [Triticum aestivum]|uniref:guanyl-specific ribonuclease pgl-1-like n=1 Tax=Triticum aestivum TaxID=4565 RepID=UPI001D030424|nr:guanyl-specific ribonuclease pgl-1-like [Triticum aestivum]